VRIPGQTSLDEIGGELKVWDAGTGQEIMDFRGHTGLIQSVAFSPDGKRLVSSSYDQTVKVWDASTGQTMLSLQKAKKFPFPDDVRGDLEKMRVAIANNQELMMRRCIWSLAFSPDGKRLVGGGGDGTVKIWDGTRVSAP
jgi:WD40 repeat protein